MPRLTVALFMWTVLAADGSSVEPLRAPASKPAASAAKAPVQPAQSAQPGTVTAPTQQTPARAAPNPDKPEKGTSVLRGQVVAADTGSPVRRAQVMASGEARRPNAVITDAEGRFEIRELPAGRYSLTAMKSGFVPSGTDVAGRVSRRPTVEVGDGQTIEKLVITLQRGGVISGRILDEFGEPVAGAEVMAMVSGFREGRRQAVPASMSGPLGMVRTDDLGAFRIFGLATGEYFVSARPPRDFGMVESGAFEGLASTYYPGSPDLSQAQRITLRAGQEMSNVHFQLVRQRLARIRGTVLNSRGEPFAGAFVTVGQSDSMTFFGGSGGPVRADGSFVVSGLGPGAYTLTVRSGMQGGEDGEMGSLALIVSGDDIDGVLIMASRGGTLRGRVTTDEGTIPTPFGSLMIWANPVDSGLRMMGPGRAQVKDDGSFEIKGLFGRRLITVGMMDGPSQWSLKSVFVNGEEVTDTGVELSGGQVVESAEIVLTRKTTEITGAVTDDRGRPPANATVIGFPAQESRWGAQSRYVRIATADQEGRFRLRGLPPYDDYLLIAVQGVETLQWTDPDFLRTLADGATRLILREGETKVQDLRLKPLGR